MNKIPILPCDTTSRGAYLENTELPTKYMEDFSLMGFVVDRYQHAVSVLTSAGFRLEKRTGGADIAIDSAGRLPEIVHLMEAHDIRCDLSDIADSLYQA